MSDIPRKLTDQELTRLGGTALLVDGDVRLLLERNAYLEQRVTEAEEWLESAMTMVDSRNCPETAARISAFLAAVDR